jgi:hypothetical protein
MGIRFLGKTSMEQSMSDLDQEYKYLANEIAIGSTADGELKTTEFFRIFSQIAAENGDSPDLEYSPVLSDEGSGYRVDGYAIDIPEGTEDESGDLYLAVCKYFQDEDLPVINAKDIERSVGEVERFLKLATSKRALDDMEESSPAYMLAILINQYIHRIGRVRVIVLTNAHLKTRKKTFEHKSLGKIALHTNVLDLERYVKISSTGADPVEVDFKEDFEGAVPCLPASTNASGYTSYLFAIHGPVLAEVFATYGNRLLEQNVRTYLQAKTNVNKGILRTIADDPEMFFAYNNGLTATASSVNTEMLPNGVLGITHITDFQIVNGGQTTASMLYARDGQKRDLSSVFVQVKLSVVDEDKLDQVVPKISEYANTQNKVSLTDLAANSPAQIRIERISKEVTVPQRAGALHAAKWFYERARGQYKSLFSYKSPSEKRKLEIEYPKNQLIEKTDLAKFELSFDGRPHHVCEGAQKCFNRYATSVIASISSTDELNEVWFKRVVAKGILFRALDKGIARSEWYKDSKGLKAQTVAYTLAACANAFRSAGLQIDLLRIWRDQDVPAFLLEWALVQAREIHGILNAPPGNVKNPSEFCKREFCWTLHVKDVVRNPEGKLIEYGIPLVEFNQENSQGKKDEKRNQELEFEVAIAKLVPRATEIKQMAESKKLISPNNSRALYKLEIGRLNFNKAEKNALKSLFERLEIEY